jgi:hypothetical protein
MVLSDDDIQKLYLSRDFPGSFTGMATMKHFIEEIYNECIPLSRLYKIMKNLPEYVFQMKPIRKYKLRSYEVDGFAQLIGNEIFFFFFVMFVMLFITNVFYFFPEIDLGFMRNYMGFQYILVAIDVYSEKIWAIALKKKSGPIVGRALEKIIISIDSPISCIQSDQGKILQMFAFLYSFVTF